MLMHEFQEWNDDKSQCCEEEMFNDFLDKEYLSLNREKVVRKILWEVYQLQICMDGLIEDMEEMS